MISVSLTRITLGCCNAISSDSTYRSLYCCFLYL